MEMWNEKARLVVNGNRQRHGVDYQETFAPVAKMVAQRSLLAVASRKGWDTCQMDVSNAILHGDLVEEVYIKPPLGYVGKEVYRRAIGKLIYLTVTRPGICYTVQLLSHFMQSPTYFHMQPVKHVLRYLLNSPCQGFLLANDSTVQLKAYCDSDWASCPMTRRSTTGYCILLGDSPISWKSKKQAVVSRSLAEAEYMAMALTCCKVTWLVSLLKELVIKDLEPVDLHYDNQAALYITINLVFHARTTHIEVYCVRDQLKARIIKPSYVHTKSQLADVFTKVVYVDQHTKLLSKLGVSQAINSQIEGECTKERG
nr:cysteine-rich RLK (receptor-like protein kinase) 8 [Tanacetum cinerariifolium]